MGAEDLVEPTRIGRFVVLDRIGEGSAGSVVRAYDPQLDRRVAVKVLRSSVERGDPDAKLRFQREARALARLSHPNVVGIHEVGTSEGRTFLAMEFVVGVDLAQWMAAHPLPTRRSDDAIALLLQAARGLAAAHAAGLVHRDFRPSNVLVGVDAAETGGPGRVRITDFGLAPAASRYMAPEQRGDGPVDAKSDQFSFCVTAWELLFGALPWPDDDSSSRPFGPELAAPPVVPAGAPRWIAMVLARGLALDPTDRHRDMDALADALVRDPRRRRRWLAAGLAMLTLVLTGGGLLAHHRATMCDDGPDALARTWNDSRRAALREGFAAHAPENSAAWAGTEARLDAFAADWNATFAAVCEAGRRRRELADETMHAAMSCLDVRRVDFEASVALLERGNREAFAHAAEITYALPAPARCGAPGSVADAVPLPTDPARAAELLALVQGLAAARVTGMTGDWEGSLAGLDELEPTLRALDHMPLLLRGELVRVEALRELQRWDDVDTRAGDAYWTALRGGDDAMASAFALELTEIAMRRQDYAGAAIWIEYARALGERARVGEDARARCETLAAHLSVALAQLERADAKLAEAMALAESAWGPAHPNVVPTRDVAVLLHRKRHEFADAARVARESVTILDAAYGPDALATSYSMGQLGNALSMLAQHDEAIALARESLRIREAWLGPDHPDVGGAYLDLSAALGNAGRHADATTAARRAAAIYREHAPPTSEMRLIAEHNLARGMLIEGEFRESAEIEAAVMRGFEAAFGADHPRVAMAAYGLGVARIELGEYQEARPPLERALAIQARTLGDRHPETLMSRLMIARIDLEAHDFAPAEAALASLLIDTTGVGTDRVRGAALVFRGIALRELGRPDEALSSWAAALEVVKARTARVSVHRQRAELLQSLGRTGAAQEAARAGLREADRTADAASVAVFEGVLAASTK